MDLAAQADGPARAGDFDRQAFDPGDPAEPGQGRNSLDFLEQSAHRNPSRPAFCASEAFFGCLLQPDGPILEAKDLSGGKLNKSNQGIMPALFGRIRVLNPGLARAENRRQALNFVLTIYAYRLATD